MKLFSLAILLGVSCLLAACGGGGSDGAERVIILQTGRMAGNVFPAESRGIAPLQHYPYLAGYVAAVRAEAAANGSLVLLIDSGDSLTGSFASYVTGSENMVRLFNRLNYDAIFLGNLDASVSESVLAQLQAQVLTPFITESGDSVLVNAPPVATLDRGKLRVRLLANFYGDTAWEDEPTRFPMWFGSRDEVRPVRDFTPFLGPASSGEAAPDLTLLHWMKFEPRELPRDFLGRLASLNVDAILAHRTYSSDQGNRWEMSTFEDWPLAVSENILQNNRGFTLARLDLVRRGGAWVALRPHQVIQLTANTADADASIVAAMDSFGPAIAAADQTLGVLDREVSEPQVMTAYMKLLAELPGADAVFYSPQSVRAPLAAGRLSASALFQALPWTTGVERLRLTRAQLNELTGMDRTVLLVRDPLPETCTLVTSRFFAQLIQRRLGLPSGSAVPFGPSNEFEFLSEQLAARGVDVLLSESLPVGWKWGRP